MGFSIRVAPGVRIRASSRGVRVGVGPRIARVHVGTGRTGFSTGVGPVGYYTSLGGSNPARSSSGRSTTYYAKSSGGLTPAQADKLQAAKKLSDELNRILNSHRHEFPPMTKPEAPAAQLINVAALTSTLRSQNLVGIRLFARAERTAAKAEAARAAQALAALQFAERLRRQAVEAEHLATWWQKLCVNDPEITEELLQRAFEDNDAAAAVLSVVGDELGLVVMVPDESVIPSRFPTTTDAGNLSIRQMTKKDQAAYYRELVSGDVLVTVREALAVAPGTNSVRIVAVRMSQPDAFGKASVEAILAAEFARRAIDAVDWRQPATVIIGGASTDLTTNYRGVGQTVAPLDLTQEPAVAELVASIDLAELS